MPTLVRFRKSGFARKWVPPVVKHGSQARPRLNRGYKSHRGRQSVPFRRNPTSRGTTSSPLQTHLVMEFQSLTSSEILTISGGVASYSDSLP